MVCVRQREAVNERGVDLVMCNGRGRECLLIIDKRKEFGIRERFERRKKHPLTAAESWKCVNHKSNARLRFHSMCSRSIQQFVATKSFWLGRVLFLSARRADCGYLKILEWLWLDRQALIDQRSNLHRQRLRVVRRHLKR